MFTITWSNIKGALISGLLMALLGILSYVIDAKSIFSVNIETLANIGAIAFLTSLVSAIKSLLTNDNGDFVGVVKVK